MAGDGADIINSWVSDVTKDKINNLVSKDAITDSALVLVNALSLAFLEQSIKLLRR